MPIKDKLQPAIYPAPTCRTSITGANAELINVVVRNRYFDHTQHIDVGRHGFMIAKLN